MRLLRALPSVLYAPLVFIAAIPDAFAIHPQAISRQANNPFKPGPQRADISSRRLLSSRALVDTCASVDTRLLTELEPLVGFKFPNSILTLDSQLCLCMEDLDLYLDSDTSMVVLASLVGRGTLKEYLEVLIKTSPSRRECTQPPDAHVCGDSNSCEIPNSGGYTHGADPCENCGNTSTGCALYASKPDSRAGTACFRSSGSEGSIAAGCRHIPNAENGSCIHGRCVVKSCVTGWIPSAGGGTCVRKTKTLSPRMMHATARDVGGDGATLDIHIIIDLANLMRALSSLRNHSDILRKNLTTPRTSMVLTSADRITRITTKLFVSRTVGSFFNSTTELLILAQGADDKLSDCEYAEDHSLDGIRADMGVFIDLTTDILGWYCSSAGVHASSGSSSEAPITISLFQLLADLGISSVETSIKAGKADSGLNDLSDIHSAGQDSKRRQETVRGLGIDSLIKQVEALVGLVLRLGDLNSLTSLKAQRSSKLATLAPVSLATLGLMTSTDISGLSDSLDLVVLMSTGARMALSKYRDCSSLVDQLSLVVKTAIVIKASCEDYSPSEKIEMPFPRPAMEPAPVPPLALHASTTNTLRRPEGTPVVVILDEYLHHLGLGGVSANMTIDGLGPGLSGTLNGILSLLNAGGRKVARDGNASSPSIIFSDLGLAKAFTTVVKSAVELESRSSAPGPVASLLTGLLPPVLSSLQAVLGSATVTGLISAVDGLLGSAKEMHKSLIDCNCTTVPVLESSGRLLVTIRGIRGWADEHPDVVRTEGTD